MIIQSEELAFDDCVESGQVFRYRASGNSWVLWEGDTKITAKKQNGSWKLSSSPNDAASRLFQLDMQFSMIAQEICDREPRMKELVKGAKGLRLLRCSSITETLFAFLCTPNNNLPRIRQMVGKLASFAESGRFPQLETICSLTEIQLRELGFGYRAQNIVKAARAVESKGGTVWLESLRNVGYRSAREELMALPGVGPKIADCVSLFGLHYTEAVPLDVHLWREACYLYFPAWSASSPTLSRYEAVSSKFRDIFGPYAGWAQQFLFFRAAIPR